MSMSEIQMIRAGDIVKALGKYNYTSDECKSIFNALQKQESVVNANIVTTGDCKKTLRYADYDDSYDNVETVRAALESERKKSDTKGELLSLILDLGENNILTGISQMEQAS